MCKKVNIRTDMDLLIFNNSIFIFIKQMFLIDKSQNLYYYKNIENA